MNRRTFFSSVVTVFGALKFMPAVPPPLMFHRDAFVMTWPPIETNARPNETLVVSGGTGYLFSGDAVYIEDGRAYKAES